MRLKVETKCLPNALGNSTQGSACVLHIRFNGKHTNIRIMNKKRKITHNGNRKINFQLKMIFNYKIFCGCLKRPKTFVWLYDAKDFRQDSI